MQQEFELLKKFSGFHFSSQFNESVTIDDLNYNLMMEYLVRSGAEEDTRQLDKIGMAGALGLVSGSEHGQPRARNFAVLMFCDRPQDFIPYARVEIIRETRRTGRMVATVFDGPVWLQVERAVDFFQEMIMSTYTMREGGRATHRMVTNWPEQAFRELLTNAVFHKDYEKPEYVGVYVYDDEIDIINHNLPLPPVTIGALNEGRRFPDRRYLNPELKEMFYALDLIETYGSGIRRAKDAMRANGNPPLSFKPTDEESDYTMVTMPINEEFAKIRDFEDGAGVSARGAGKDIATTGKDECVTDTKTDENECVTDTKDHESSDVTDEETNDVRDRIVLMLAENPGLTLRDIAEHVGLSLGGVRYHLSILRKNHVVAREGSTRSGRWVVVDKEEENAEG